MDDRLEAIAISWKDNSESLLVTSGYVARKIWIGQHSVTCVLHTYPPCDKDTVSAPE